MEPCVLGLRVSQHKREAVSQKQGSRTTGALLLPNYSAASFSTLVSHRTNFTPDTKLRNMRGKVSARATQAAQAAEKIPLSPDKTSKSRYSPPGGQLKSLPVNPF